MRYLYIKANNDIIYLDRIIKCEFTPASHNNSIMAITYVIDNLNLKEPIITSVFEGVSKQALTKITEAIDKSSNFVDISL